jgi:hypothetical protein
MPRPKNRPTKAGKPAEHQPGKPGTCISGDLCMKRTTKPAARGRSTNNHGRNRDGAAPDYNREGRSMRADISEAELLDAMNRRVDQMIQQRAAEGIPAIRYAMHDDISPEECAAEAHAALAALRQKHPGKPCRIFTVPAHTGMVDGAHWFDQFNKAFRRLNAES